MRSRRKRSTAVLSSSWSKSTTSTRWEATSNETESDVTFSANTKTARWSHASSWELTQEKSAGRSTGSAAIGCALKQKIIRNSWRPLGNNWPFTKVTSWNGCDVAAYLLYFWISYINMTTAINEQEFVSLCAKGNFEAAEKKLKKDNLDVNCKEKDSNSTDIQPSIPPPTLQPSTNISRSSECWQTITSTSKLEKNSRTTKVSYLWLR